MILAVLFGAALGSVGAVVVSDVPAPAPLQAPVAQPKSIETLWSQLGEAIQGQDSDAAILLCKALEAHPNFAREPLSRRNAVTALLGLLYVEIGQDALALPYLIEATERGSGTLDLWFARINAYVRARDRTAAAHSVSRMLERYPEAHSDLSRDFVIQLHSDPGVARDARFALRLALRDSGWRDRHDSGVWLSLIDDLLERDRSSEATPLVERVTSSSGLIRLHAMKRYDDLRTAAGSPELDIAAVLDAELARDRAAAEAAGAGVDARNTYATALLSRGRFEEGLAFMDATLAMPPPEPGSEAAEDLTWAMDTRARLLMELGRREEAIAQMEVAAKREEGANANVSQTINLAWFHMRIGDNALAVDTVKALDSTAASPFGVMQAMQVRACAGTTMGDDRVAGPAFAHLEQNWRDAPFAWVEAQACRGDADGAADTLMLMLADKDLADGAVALLHDYLVDQRATEYDRRVADSLAAAFARADVIAARDRIARRFTVPTVAGLF